MDLVGENAQSVIKSTFLLLYVPVKYKSHVRHFKLHDEHLHCTPLSPLGRWGTRQEQYNHETDQLRGLRRFEIAARQAFPWIQGRAR